METKVKVTARRLSRYPVYLKYLKTLKENGITSVSSPLVAKEMKCSEEQVRKDFQAISTSSGKPKLGRDIDCLIDDIESFLGYNDACAAILVGAGSLGNAFMNYEGFKKYGLNLMACFDKDPNKIGKTINGKTIYPIEELEEFVSKNHVSIAILSVPMTSAQEACDLLVRAGIKGILNFAPVHLKVKEGVVLDNVDLASSLAILSQKVKDKQNMFN